MRYDRSRWPWWRRTQPWWFALPLGASFLGVALLDRSRHYRGGLRYADAGYVLLGMIHVATGLVDARRIQRHNRTARR